MTGEGWHSITSGYGEMTIIRTNDGPQVEGEVPNRIGCQREMLDMVSPAFGTWDSTTGTLVLVGYHFQQIGVDGPDIVVFERQPA